MNLAQAKQENRQNIQPSRSFPAAFRGPGNRPIPAAQANTIKRLPHVDRPPHSAAPGTGLQAPKVGAFDGTPEDISSPFNPIPRRFVQVIESKSAPANTVLRTHQTGSARIEQNDFFGDHVRLSESATSRIPPESGTANTSTASDVPTHRSRQAFRTRTVSRRNHITLFDSSDEPSPCTGGRSMCFPLPLSRGKFGGMRDLP